MRAIVGALQDYIEREEVTLVASSKLGSKKYQAAAFGKLSHKQMDSLREDLPKLLPKLGDRFYSSVSW
jgi:hypothetical protein